MIGSDSHIDAILVRLTFIQGHNYPFPSLHTARTRGLEEVEGDWRRMIGQVLASVLYQPAHEKRDS